MKKNTEKDINRLWWFNPQNDLALAANTAYYTPTKAAAQLARAGELLPACLAADGDMILTGGINDRWLSRLSATAGIDFQLYDRNPAGLSPSPWGWSAAARQTFIQLGFSPEQCPDSDTLETYRCLSGRATAQQLSRLIFPSIADNRVLTAAEDIDRIFDQSDNIVIKTPWSCSGRGVAFFSKDNYAEARRRVADIIAAYGYATVEPRLDAPFEFALLFQYDGSQAAPVALSRTVAGGAAKYAGNIISSFETHKSVIDSKAECPGLTDRLMSATQSAIAKVLGDRYQGPIGVDFLIGDGKVHLAEHNLRYTMGFVADALYRRSRLEGMLTILPGQEAEKPDAIYLTQPGSDIRFAVVPTS